MSGDVHVRFREGGGVRFPSATRLVVSFQYKRDAERFHRMLTARFRRFSLELAEEKTRLLLFGRFARETKAEYGERPETFEFLGFKHVCGVDQHGRFALVRIPSHKSCRKFLARTREWLRRHPHWERRDRNASCRSCCMGSTSTSPCTIAS